MLNGLYIVVGSWTRIPRKWLVNAIGLEHLPRLYRIVKVAITFILFTLAAVFFKAESLSDAWYILTHLHTKVLDLFVAMITGDTKMMQNITNVTKDLLTLGFDKWYYRAEMIIALAAVAVMAFVEIAQEYLGKEDLFHLMPKPLRWVMMYLLTISVLFLGMTESAQFEYFRF